MNITQMITGFATPIVASKIAGALGVPEGMVRRVIALAAPLVLGAVLKRSSTPGGTDAIGAALNGLGSNPLDALGKTLGGDASQITKAGSAGSDLLSSLLGGSTTGAIASKLASYAGIDAKAAGPLLGLTGSMALGGLKKTADDQGLDAAGVVKLLQSQKGDIAAAIPADFAAKLEGTDILGSDLLSSARQTAAAAAPRVAPVPPPKSGGMNRWIIGLIVLALLAWLLSRLLGGTEEEAVVEEPAPAPAASEPAAEPAEAEPPAAEPTEAEPPAAEPAEAEPPAAEPAATDQAAAPADNPLLVDGVDIGASLQGVLDKVSGALTGVTDAATAQSAVAALTEADGELGTIQTAAANLPAEGSTALKALIAGALPALQSTVERLLADTAIGPVVKPALDGIMAKLNALAA